MKEIAIKAALEASKILKENFGKISSSQIDLKRQFDFVTYVDTSAEQKIIQVIKNDYPDHKFYAEESDKDESGGYRWIIDPLDGTTNYIHGNPVFAISIALEYDKKIILGVIYDPMRDELFTAEKDKGATLNGKAIQVSEIADPALSLLTTGFPFRSKHYLELYLESFKQLFYKVSGIRRMGSVALDFSYLACGRCEGFWEIGLAPWDIAAGYLIVKEAGGLMTDFAGGDSPVWTGNVIASNGKLHATIKNVVNDVFAGTIEK